MLRAGTQEGGVAAPQSKETDAQELHRDGTWPDRFIASRSSTLKGISACVANKCNIALLFMSSSLLDRSIFPDWLCCQQHMLVACCSGDAAYTGVVLRYNPRQTALQDVTLHIAGGEHVSICGRTGGNSVYIYPLVAPKFNVWVGETGHLTTRVYKSEVLFAPANGLLTIALVVHRRWEVEPGGGAPAHDAADVGHHPDRRSGHCQGAAAAAAVVDRRRVPAAIPLRRCESRTDSVYAAICAGQSGWGLVARCWAHDGDPQS